MAGSKHNIIPEYHSTDIVTFSRGDILNVYDKNGIIIETYILENLNGIKVWKRQQNFIVIVKTLMYVRLV